MPLESKYNLKIIKFKNTNLYIYIYILVSDESTKLKFYNMDFSASIFKIFLFKRQSLREMRG